MNMLNKNALILILASLSIFLISCEKEVIKEISTVAVDEIIAFDVEGNTIAVGTSIAVGQTVSFTAITDLEDDAGEVYFEWFADEGEFEGTAHKVSGSTSTNEESQIFASGDTVKWKAPDDEGTYTISVHATDGEYIGIGTRAMGVGAYTPTITPFYVGDEACSSCHTPTYGDWAMTGHSVAWTSLNESSHVASYCNPCHAVGYEGESGNSGYDEVPIADFVNVQCENCHGAGSNHISSPSKTNIEVTWTVDNCGKCHEGSHHPYLTEWTESAHNFDETSSHGAPTAYGGSCSGCHEGVAGGIRLAGDLTTFYGSGAVADRPSFDDVPATGVTCQTCHDSHNADNPGQLRTVGNVQLVAANGETPVVTDGGTGKLCMQCHHARRSGDTQVIDGYGHFGPHASPQTDMMASKSAYHGVAPAGFAWADPSHLDVQNSCKTCHINMVEYDGTAAVTGHTFESTVEACASCHGQINSFKDIMALEDFDGDGIIEGLQDEVSGIMVLLTTALNDRFATAGLDPTADDWDLIHELGIVTHYLDENDSTNTFDVPIEWREAGYNLAFTADDKSLGVHNPDYAIQILQQSFNHLTGALPSAMVVSNDQTQAVAKW